ncbi:hypothetical protein ACHAXT_004970 [Thalassiosira profunda]
MSADDTPGLIEDEICDNANAAATSRLRDMQRRIESRGLDPTGKEEMYRFSEIICRDEGGRRYDVPVAFLGDGAGENKLMQNSVGSGRMGTPLQLDEEEAIRRLHCCIGDIVQPVIDCLWADSEKYASDVAAAGFLVNEPGSTSQNWHRDGLDGFIDCFVPLIDLTDEMGPTAIKPCTHTYTGSVDTASDVDILMPLMRKGEVLLFDYRTIHRGQGNRSESSRTLAYAVWKRLERGKADAGDIHNFPAALTLEYD